ncbi:hypothetical protein QTP86_005145 [Hemibagrus guttatus]|nr:hypothetical protein QTP86_005145 [Hemibagrus guttatus]
MRFEAQNNVAARKTIPPPNNQVLCLSTADVRRTLHRVNPRKSAGPDNIPGRVLKECAEQLADVFTDILNISLSSAIVPTCLKTTTIIPMPKKSTVSCLNDYRPVALTPIVMKCFERLVMRHIKTQLPPSLDPLQFAYRPNHSTDDAITTTLHLSLTHLDNKDTYVRMLFIDFSSAFNTIIPQHLIEKLSLLGLNTSLCNCILDFLTGRPQSVRIRNSFSSIITLSTGAPQGCVLSPLLFTLLTHNCAAMHSSNHIVKFADDTIVVGLISKNDRSAYRQEVQRLTVWCKANSLSLNVDKTKEMVVDFRRAQSDHSPLFIDGSPVEIVKSTKFLGVHLVENFTWSLNTTSITKKYQQHLYFLRRLRKILQLLLIIYFCTLQMDMLLWEFKEEMMANCNEAEKELMEPPEHEVKSKPGESFITPYLLSTEKNFTREQVGCELEEKERFWSELDEVMESIPTGERVVIGADFNGHVGEGNTGDEEVMGKFGVKERNLEGQMVVDFAKRMDMAVVNTYFQKREEHRVTYKSGEVIRETGRKVLGVSSGRRKEDKETWWWNEEVQDSIQRKRLAKKKWDMDRTEENRQEYKESQHRVKREVSKAKLKAYDELYTRLDTREGEKDLYRLARQRDRDGKDVQQVRVIKDRDGRVFTSEESVQRRWKEYFEELMNEENEREKE